MLKFEKEVKERIENKLEKEGMFDKNIINWITNRYLTLVLELDKIFDEKVLAILTKSFSMEELEKYSKEYLQYSWKYEIDREFAHILSRKTGLNNEERKNEYKTKVRELVQLILNAINGDKQAYQEFVEKYDKYVFDKSESENLGLKKFIPLGILICLSRNQDNPLNFSNIEKFAMKNVDRRTATFVVSDIRSEVGCLLGLRKRKKDATELLNDFKTMIEDSAENDDSDKKDETIESIKLERDQYKSSLILIQKSFDELVENLQEETKNIASEQIKEFFISLNSGKYGNFLDKIPLTEDLLKEIRTNNIEVPQEVKRVLIFIKSVIKFIKDQGVTPIKEVNTIFEGTAEDIAQMDYVGEEFLGDEVKKLRVVAPGYTYKDYIISIPKVEEVNE